MLYCDSALRFLKLVCQHLDDLQIVVCQIFQRLTYLPLLPIFLSAESFRHQRQRADAQRLGVLEQGAGADVVLGVFVPVDLFRISAGEFGQVI